MRRPDPGDSKRSPRMEHAVVLGAGIAGLCAAAALAGRAGRVTVVERDALARVDEPRKGVPQGRHFHALLPAGSRALDALFPGFVDELRRAGAQLLRAPEDFGVHVGGGRLALGGLDPSFVVVGATRPLIEGIARERVRALPNVRLRGRWEALGLSAADGGRRVTGVRVRRAHTPGSEETVPADLVVDATGRGSRTHRWLETLGYAGPEELRVPVDVRYTTRLFRRAAGEGGPRLLLIGVPPDGRRGGSALAVEGDRWQVVLAGVLGEQAPGELAGFRTYARTLQAGVLADLVERAEPIGEAVTGSYAANSWRRYDRMRRFPERLAIVGDAVCPLNPLYAQGMSVAATEGLALARVVDRTATERVGPAFLKATRGLVGACWTQAVDEDLAHPDVDGPRTLRWRLLRRYGERLVRAAHSDPVVGRTLFEVMSLQKRGRSLMQPRVLVRALSEGRSSERARTAGARLPAAPPSPPRESGRWTE